tara:strand:- start:3472 stop:3867 length:396 start_codon:yes stop_codon:yes gene_type:complete
MSIKNKTKNQEGLFEEIESLSENMSTTEQMKLAYELVLRALGDELEDGSSFATDIKYYYRPTYPPSSPDWSESKAKEQSFAWMFHALMYLVYKGVDEYSEDHPENMKKTYGNHYLSLSDFIRCGECDSEIL